jgi:hypothetical protein
MGEQAAASLGADAGHAGDVVHRVAAKGEVVGDLVRMHAEFSCTPAGPQRRLRAKSHCSSCSPSSWPKSLSAETITLGTPWPRRLHRVEPIRSSAS